MKVYQCSKCGKIFTTSNESDFLKDECCKYSDWIEITTNDDLKKADITERVMYVDLGLRILDLHVAKYLIQKILEIDDIMKQNPKATIVDILKLKE